MLPKSSTKPAQEGERKLVTVLFTDIVGSTSLAEQLDPEDWADIVSGAHAFVTDAVERFGGRIAQLLGDGVLAFFGAPVSHEDDPERAVFAALAVLDSVAEYERELQRSRRVPNFKMRVGLNTGLVVVGNVGAGKHVEYLAVGDTVNLAARMQSAAEPNTICIAENTARSVRHAFDLQSLGKLDVKGKAEPVSAFRVLAAKAVPESKRGIVGLDSPIVGRDREIAELRARLSNLLSGKGSIVSLMADAGLGKSRLIGEIVLRAPEDFARFEGRSMSFDSATPYAAFADLFNRWLGLHDGLTAEQKYARIGDPFIATMLGVPPQGDDIERVKFLDPALLRANTFAAIVARIAQAAGQQPLALVFEDLHWADTTSLDLLEQLMGVAERAPLLLLAAFRPQREEPSYRFHEVAQRDHAAAYAPIALEPLPDGESRQLVANLLEIEDLPEKVRALILKKAEGNPFYVEEVIRSLLDAGLVVREGDHWRATKDIENINLPDSLAGLITARLDRLDDDAKRTAQTAAVIGREFGLDVLGDVIEVAGFADKSAGLMGTLEAREIVREKAIQPPVYLFKHTLTQEAAYNSLLLSKRRAIHRKVGECLEQTEPARSGEIAQHYLAAQEPERALPFLVDAGDKLLRAYAVADALKLLTQALQLAKEQINLPLARRAYEAIGRAKFMTGDLAGTLATYQDMEEFAVGYHDVPMRISALNKMSEPATYTGQFEMAFDALNKSEELAKAHNDKVGMAEHYLMRCTVSSAMADFDSMVDHLGNLVQSGRDLNRDYEIAFGLVHSANARTYLLDFPKAAELAREAREFTQSVGDLDHYAQAVTFSTAFVHLAHGDVDAAIAACEEGIGIGGRIGALFAESNGSITLSYILRWRGEYERSIALAQRGLQKGQLVGFPFLMAMALVSEGMGYFEIGPSQRDKTLALHTQAAQLLEHPLGAFGGTLPWADLAECALALGNFDAANAYAEKALTYRAPQILLFKPRALMSKAEICIASGDANGALEAANQAQDFAHEHGMRWFYPMTEHSLGKAFAASHEHEPAVEHFARAIELAEPMKFRPTIWRARECMADALMRLGRHAEAEFVRGQALEMADEIIAQFANDELRDAMFARVHGQLDPTA